MKWSRGLESFAKMVRAVLPTLDYQACYFAKVVGFNFDRQQVDLVPDDARLPTMQGIPLRIFPGAVIDLRDPTTGNVAGGITVLVTWENADPSRAVAFGFGAGARVPSVTLNADQIVIGGGDGAEPAAKGQTLQTYLEHLAGLLTAHVHPSGIGPTGVAATLASIAPPDVLATKAKVN